MGTALYAWLVPHFPLILYYIYAFISGNPIGNDPVPLSGGTRVLLITLAALMIGYHFYSTIRLHIWPLHHKNESGSFRVGVQYGGLFLIRIGIWGFWIQLLHYLFFYVFPPQPVEQFIFALRSATHTNGTMLLASDIIYTVIFLFLFLLNGCVRIILCCHRLGIVKRVLICLNIWIPVVNLFLIHYLARAAKDEYAIYTARNQSAQIRQASLECRTGYPLIMVHGIGFRDLKYFNYWGRAPRYLLRNGATIYYGHQKAWGTIEENAAAIAQTIDRALEETGAKKVNIIAHSKGGLDSRYLITHMNYADKVASLTTMSTPHHGSELLDLLNQLPKPVFRKLAQILDRSFETFGDDHPDSYASAQQLSPAYCKEFNERTPDAENVLYQSYASVMRFSFSDSLLFFPHLLLWLKTGERNDGLVTESSARWGNYLGTLKSKSLRGISHGDMIDLKREDIKGFDSIEIYQSIVQNLKQRGF
ncbi:MAG: triacylglycerol lipase [Lachnospiraceae bacterium]|nr:triacylglycerol lipase [Lachnospiraceae bacterium]